ncbi:hypothetical protein ACXET9_12525 [Brachybacterium sp. DNPG3]
MADDGTQSTSTDASDSGRGTDSSRGTGVDIDRRIRELSVWATIADDTLIMEVDIAGSEDELWRALTDPEQLARWSPVVPDRPLTTVGPALARENPDDEPVAADVLAVAGEHAVTHRWGDATVGWMIEEGRLDLQVGLPRLEDAQYFAAGWQVCLAVLDAQLQGIEQERIVGRDALDHGWEELRRGFAEEFGHELGEASGD